MQALHLMSDQTNDDAQMRASHVGQLNGAISAQLSFVESDLLKLDESLLEETQNCK